MFICVHKPVLSLVTETSRLPLLDSKGLSAMSTSNTFVFSWDFAITISNYGKRGEISANDTKPGKTKVSLLVLNGQSYLNSRKCAHSCGCYPQCGMHLILFCNGRKILPTVKQKIIIRRGTGRTRKKTYVRVTLFFLFYFI